MLVDDASVNLAKVVHLKFKLDWIDSAAHKAELIDLLKRSVSRLAGSQGSELPTASSQDSQEDTGVNFFAKFAELKNRCQNYTVNVYT